MEKDPSCREIGCFGRFARKQLRLALQWVSIFPELLFVTLAISSLLEEEEKGESVTGAFGIWFRCELFGTRLGLGLVIIP